MYYRPILKQALGIVIHNKFLWVLGFFAAFLNMGGVYDVLWRGWNFIITRTTMLSTRFTAFSLEESGWSLSYQSSPWLLILILVALTVLCVGFIFLAVSAQGGLVFATKKLSGLKGKVGLKAAWKEGIKKFWHLFGFNLLGRMLVFVLLFLSAVPVFLCIGGSGKLGYIFSLISFLVFVPLALVVSFTIIYGLNHIVLKRADIRDAFHESITLFKKFWLESLEFALIILGVNVLLALALAFIFIFLFLPFLILGTGLYLLFGAVGLWVNVVLFILICLAIFVVAGSIFGAFQTVVWTLFYLKISRGIMFAKIARLLAVFKR